MIPKEQVVSYVMNRYGYFYHHEADELEDVGRFALFMAEQDHNPKGGAKFETYAINRVKWAIQHYLQGDNGGHREGGRIFKQKGPVQARYDDKPFKLDPLSFKKGLMMVSDTYFERVQLEEVK